MKLFSRIFSMLVIALAFSVLFCTPTFAEESLSISVDGVAETELDPNTFGTSSVDVYVTSTARDGYKLSISDSDENNSLVSSNGNSINPLAESVTESNFTTNAWGVKVGDNFLPVPKLTDNVLELVSTNQAAENEKNTVTFGMKVDGTATSGAYSSEVVFTAVANPLVVHKTTLKTGQQVNAAWKTLANNSSITYITTDNKITSVQKFTGDFTDALRSVAQDIATADSAWPVYTWFDNGTIYYYTEADEVFFNTDSSFMFYGMQELASVDFNFGLETDVDPDSDGFIASVQDPVYITSSATNMNSMFNGARSLASLDVSNWDTSSVANMNSMFRDASSLASLDVSNWDTSKVTGMKNMFSSASSLTSLNASNWNTSSVTNMSSMFNGASALTSLDVSNWDTGTVTDMNSMFYGASSLTSLNASNWDTSKVTNMRTMFASTSSLTSLNASNWDTSSVTNMSSMFNGASSLTSLDAPNWDTSKVTNMNSMFYSASALTTLDVSNWDTSSVTDMGSMFGGVSALTSLNVSNWNTSSVTNMGGMFNGARSLTSLDVSNWNTSSVTNMSNMFYNTSALTSLDVSRWDTSKVTYMYNMFSQASALTSLDVSNWDTSKVTSMSYMFADARSLTALDVSNWNTSSVTDMGGMLGGISALTALDVSNWDTSKVTNMSRMFRNASSLTSLDLSNWDTSSVTDMNNMFYNARSLTSLDVSNWNTSKVTSMYHMFSSASALTTIYASDKFDTNAVTNSADMFSGASSLVGGNGTTYNTSHIDKEYARIDTPTTPGYFTLKTYAVRTSTLKTGEQVNAAWLSLANGGTTAHWDSNITSIKKFTGNFTSAIQSSAVNIATDNSDYPVWSWYDNRTIYYYTESDEVFLNADSSGMFTSMENLASMDFNFGLATDVDPDGDGIITSRKAPVYITSNVTNMNYMFSNVAFVTLDLSKWDTSSVTSMKYMFAKLNSLTTIYASNLFTTSAVTSTTDEVFYGTDNLVGGNGATWGWDHTGKEYARIDTPTTPGYFTLKTN